MVAVTSLSISSEASHMASVMSAVSIWQLSVCSWSRVSAALSLSMTLAISGASAIRTASAAFCGPVSEQMPMPLSSGP